MNIKGKKQVEALENVKDHKKRLVIINDYEDELLHSWEQEIFKDIYNKRLHKIEGVTEKIDDNNLVFTALSTEKNPDFSKKDDPLTFLNKIRKGKITIEEAKESQKDFNNYLKKYEEEIKLNNKEKHWQFLICFSMEELMQLTLLKAMVQWFLRLKKGLLKNKQNKTEQNLKY